jgi:hypothetical protein
MARSESKYSVFQCRISVWSWSWNARGDSKVCPHSSRPIKRSSSPYE